MYMHVGGDDHTAAKPRVRESNHEPPVKLLLAQQHDSKQYTTNTHAAPLMPTCSTPSTVFFLYCPTVCTGMQGGLTTAT
jgi:hypothetical protein